jgi:hypothetical protein
VVKLRVRVVEGKIIITIAPGVELVIQLKVKR